MSTETTRVKRNTAPEGMLREGGRKPSKWNLLSDEVWVMGCLHLEGAVIRPQVDRIGDACTSSFIDLFVVSVVSQLV